MKRQVIQGFFEEFVQRMIKAGGAIHPSQMEAGSSYSAWRVRGHAHITPFDSEVFKSVAEEICSEAGVTLLFNMMFQPWGEACRPNAMILCYPVITAGEYAHRNSFLNLLGEDHDALCDSVSLEKLVSKDTPPTFLWHTWEDGAVPVENSLLFAAALRKYGISCEMHIWQHGGHGLSLSSDEVYPLHDQRQQPACQEWPELAARWLKEI